MKTRLYQNWDGSWSYEVVILKTFFRKEKTIYIFNNYNDYLKFKPSIGLTVKTTGEVDISNQNNRVYLDHLYMKNLLLNNDKSYKELITAIPTTSVNQQTWKDVNSITLYFWDSIDRPNYKVTLTKEETRKLKSIINSCF